MKIKELTNLTLGCNVVTPEMFCHFNCDLFRFAPKCDGFGLLCCCLLGGGGGGAACVIMHFSTVSDCMIISKLHISFAS